MARFARRVAMLCGVALLLGRAPVAAETLADAVAAAYRTNPALASQRAGTRATDETVAQARAAYGPTVDASFGAGYERDRFIGGPLGDTTNKGFTTNYAAQVSQPLYTFGRLSSQLDAARATADIGQATLRATELQVLSDTISAYIAVIRDQALVAIARENADLLVNQSSETAARFKAGDATDTDRGQTENRVALARGQLADAEGQLRASADQYAALVGHAPGDLAPLPKLPAPPATLDAAYQEAEKRSPAIAVATLTETRSRAAIASQRAERGPTVALQGVAQRGAVLPYDNSYRQFSLLGRVNVSLPLYTSGLVSSRIREAEQASEQAAFQLDQTRRQVRLQIGQSWDRLAATRASIPRYQEAVQAAEAALRGATAQERAGDLIAIDVLDQARDLLQSRTAAAEAEANAYLYQVSLLAVTGLLDVRDVAPGTPIYDPLVHYAKVTRKGGTLIADPLFGIDRLARDRSIGYRKRDAM